jgi:predicted DCC family thiol-disulfide oxidoreductase YuxK
MTNSNQASSWEIKLLYDGDCPLCVREVNFLRQKDAGKRKVVFINIADDDYYPPHHGNIDYETAMAKIHAVLADGSIVKNMEVFRQVYNILGMGWIYSWTKLPLIGKIVEQIYEIWAYWRLKITGRPDLVTLVNQRNKRLKSTGKITCQ